MADKKISDLPSVTNAELDKANDVIPVVDIGGSSNKKITINELFTDVDVTGNLSIGGTLSGRDVSADGTKLDGIEELADVTDTANVEAAGALMDSELASEAAVKATTASFLVADETKLDGIEALADVTDTTNVEAAGALMDSEVDANLKTLVLPASTTISTFGASLVDDVDEETARTTLDVDQAGTALALTIALG
jgi:hypothetical protein